MARKQSVSFPWINYIEKDARRFISNYLNVSLYRIKPSINGRFFLSIAYFLA